MMPVGPLMIEHRLIEKMIKLLEAEIVVMQDTGQVDGNFIHAAADFMHTYADRCHHGKEEDILFVDLANRSLSPELKQIMDDLIREHAWARQRVSELVAATDRSGRGEQGAVRDVIANLSQLVQFYPQHIQKEDKRFFMPVMGYMSKEEQAAMLDDFWEFDRMLIHEKYKAVVEDLRRERAS